MMIKTARLFTISLPNPRSSECGSSRETQEPRRSCASQSNKRIQKYMNHIMPVMAVAAVLTLGVWTPLSAEEEKEESISSSDVPAAVQQAAQAEVKGGTIVRWEKEGSNYEAVVEKNGKQTGIEIDANGKVVSRHDESKEHKEKGEKGEKY